LFDKVYGEGNIIGVEAFQNRIREDIATGFDQNSMGKFGSDLREYLLEKINPTLPETYLRKWLLLVNKSKEVNEENFDREFPTILENIKWDQIVKAIVKQFEINISENELLEFAKVYAHQQFSMYYGVNQMSDESLTQFATNMLKDENTVQKIAFQLFENKTTYLMSNIVTLNIQEISLTDYNNMIYASMDQSDAAVEEVKEEVAETVTEETAETVEEETVEAIREDAAETVKEETVETVGEEDAGEAIKEVAVEEVAQAEEPEKPKKPKRTKKKAENE
jgi:trigger factor